MESWTGQRMDSISVQNNVPFLEQRVCLPLLLLIGPACALLKQRAKLPAKRMPAPAQAALPPPLVLLHEAPNQVPQGRRAVEALMGGPMAWLLAGLPPGQA